MHYRKIGKYGLKISEISIGSWLTYGESIENKIAFDCIDTAIEHGINFIDSAEGYANGGAESLIGDYLSQEVISRDDLVISSKTFWPMGENINRWGLSRKNIITAVEGTLKRLKTDHLDLYFMHRFDHTTPLEETILTIDDLIKAGKIRYWGTSSWSAAQIERANAMAKELNAHPPIVEQPLYNMFRRHIELEIMEVAKGNGMGLTAYSPLAQGILTGKYNNGIPKDSRAAHEENLKNDLIEENIEKVRKLAKVAERIEISVGNLALAWILRKPEISCAIIGASKPHHIIENVKASDIKLTNDDLAEINNILDNEPSWPPTYEPFLFYEDKMH